MTAGAANGRSDAIMIGACHNGLIAAAYLAKAGRRVLVLEAREVIGGAATTEQLAPGFRVPACAHLLYHLHPRITADLDLRARGLDFARQDLATVALDPGGSHLAIASGIGADRVEALNGAGPSPEDRAALGSIRQRLRSYADALAPSLTRAPPRLGGSDWADRATLLKLGWSIRRLGRAGMRDFLQIALMNAADLLENEIEHPLLLGALAFDAVLGGNVGPRSPNTVLNLIYRATGQVNGRPGALAVPRGGMGAVTQALARAALDAGAEIRTACPVERVLVEADRAVGVRLSSGETLAASAVLSNADPKRSFLELLGPEHLDAGFAKRVSQIRAKGNTAKLNLALEARPSFTGLPGARHGDRLLIAPSIDYLERAFNPTKYGELPAQPALEITIPSLHDPSLAPEGCHVLSAVVQYAPHRLKAGWSGAREAFAKRLIELLEGYAPGMASTIAASELLTPEDIESRFGITGGHWHHGELIVDQMLMLRPLHGAAQYDTPVEGFYLCGAGTHPGGNVTGVPGMNAARRLLDRKGP